MAVTDVYVSHDPALGYPQPARFTGKTTANGHIPDPLYPESFLVAPAELVHPYRHPRASEFYEVIQATGGPTLLPKPQGEVDAILAADQAAEDARNQEKQNAYTNVQTTRPIPSRVTGPPPQSVVALRDQVYELEQRVQELEIILADKSYL